MLTKSITAQSDQATNNKISNSSRVKTRHRVVRRVIMILAAYLVVVYGRT